MYFKFIRSLLLITIGVLSIGFYSCSNDKKEDPVPQGGNDPEEELTIVGKWTIEDYRTGEYSTFDFKNNGEYILLQPFYERMDKSAGRYNYDPETQTICFEHYYSDDDFKDYGDNPDFATDLTLRCKLDKNTLTLIGEDCEELGLANPVVLKKGGYSGICPDFRNLLCSRGKYKFKENTYEGYVETDFTFNSNGKVELLYSMVVNYPDGTQGYGSVYATGTFSVEKYLLNCRFSNVAKTEDNLGYASTSLWDKFIDSQSLNLSFYLALDNDDQVIINDYPIYK